MCLVFCLLLCLFTSTCSLGKSHTTVYQGLSLLGFYIALGLGKKVEGKITQLWQITKLTTPSTKLCK